MNPVRDLARRVRGFGRPGPVPHRGTQSTATGFEVILLRLEALSRLANHYGDDLAASFDLTRFEASVFSQSGEDGVIAEILFRIGSSSKWFVEFGGDRGVQNNCLLLADVFGWQGLFIEADGDKFAQLSSKFAPNPRVRTTQSFVTPANVEDLFAAVGVPEELDVLSIDVDGADWWIWRALSRYRPRIVVTEYNGALDLDARLTVPLDFAGWDEATSYFGASLGAFEALAHAKGYRLVHTELTGTNAFWVREDLAGPFVDLEAPRRASNYWLMGAQLDPAPPDSVWIDVSDVV